MTSVENQATPCISEHIDDPTVEIIVSELETLDLYGGSPTLPRGI